MEDDPGRSEINRKERVRMDQRRNEEVSQE